MDPIDAIDGVLPDNLQQNQTAENATDAFGLGFEELLTIVLTQLTYQDPLKPIDNFEFVSQLAQFSQIQQTQTMTERLDGILGSQSTLQATSLLGQIVDVPAGPTTLTGTVTSVAIENGLPRLTIETPDDRTISNIALSSINQIRVEDN